MSREPTVSSCCSPQGHEAIFDDRFARSVADRYRRRGLTTPERHIVAFLTQHDLTGCDRAGDRRWSW